MRTIQTTYAVTPRARLMRLTGAATLCLLASGCTEILKSEAPQLIEESTLRQPANAQVIVAGLRADFECALGQYVAVMGTVADEFADSQGNAAIWDIDRRTSFASTSLYATGGCGGFGGVYTPVSAARYQADNTLQLLGNWTDAEVPGRQALMARAGAYAGYSLVLLGEGFCSAAIDVGPEMTPAQIFAAAEERFTLAITNATATGGASGDSIRYMALVGRARARINQAKYADAAADAALVPTGFAFNARYSAASGRSENRVFRVNNTSGTITVDPSYRALRVNGAVDPRVPVVDAGRGGSQPTIPLWSQGKYTSLTSPIPIATWREARLIQAEAALQANNVTAAVGFINDLRQRAGVELAAYAGGDATAVRAQLVEERRRELFLEGQRLYDTIRFNVPLNPAPGASFPSGGTYGDNKCLPLPDIERLNNPNIPAA